MPIPRSKSAGTPKDAPAKSTPASTTDTSTDVTTTSGKPDKKAYDAEQDKIKSEIDALQVKLSAVKGKVALATKDGSANGRRTTLRAELDDIRGQQSNSKMSRSKIIEQVDALNTNIQKKIKDLQAAKAKIPFKTVTEVDAHIKTLETRVESGSMKLAEEKRALQEISQTKRLRRQVEAFQASQDSIDADRAAVEGLRTQLNDPQSVAASARYDEIKKELDEIKKMEDEAYAGRSKLFAERDTLQEELNVLFNRKRESGQNYREANDRYYQKLNEDRARRAERARAQRAAEEAEKKQEIVQRLREEAEAPAFQAQIEDCQTLIDYFSGNTTGTVILKSIQDGKKAVTGVPELDIRKVDAAPDGLVARKKKGEDEESYFVGKSKKGKKGGAKAADSNGTTASSSSQLNVPLPTLSALLSLSIPPPASSVDVPRVVEDLQTKKAWFQANQARVTAENIAKAEADIKRLTKDANSEPQENGGEEASTQNVTGPNGGGENPAEPAHTPQTSELSSTAVPSEAVVDKLEAVQETNSDES